MNILIPQKAKKKKKRKGEICLKCSRHRIPHLHMCQLPIKLLAENTVLSVKYMKSFCLAFCSHSQLCSLKQLRDNFKPGVYLGEAIVSDYSCFDGKRWCLTGEY